MKFLSVIAASLAAFAAAQEQQKSSSLRGGMKDRFNQQKNRWSQQKGGQDGKDWSQKYKGGQDGKGKGKGKGRDGRSKGACSVAKIPKEQQDKLAAQFKALDVSGNDSLEPKEFKGEATKILDAFQNYRKGQKPSWYKGRKGGRGRGGDTKNGEKGGDTKNGGRPSRGGDKRNGGKGRPDRNGKAGGDAGKAGGDAKKGFWNKSGNRQLAESQDFRDYLRQHGFGMPQKTQSEKDRDEANRADKVFQKFDRDGNDHVSLCEYENAMYRTEQLEKMMQQKGGKDDIVIVKDH